MSQSLSMLDWQRQHAGSTLPLRNCRTHSNLRLQPMSELVYMIGMIDVKDYQAYAESMN